MIGVGPDGRSGDIAMSKTGFDTEYAAASGRGVSIFARKRQLTVFIDVAVSGHGGWCRTARGLTLV
jgi:hypothetical protein